MTGREVKQIMHSLGFTQQQLADALGVARNTINRWANDLEPIPKIAELAMGTVTAQNLGRRHATGEEGRKAGARMFSKHRELMKKLAKR